MMNSKVMASLVLALGASSVSAQELQTTAGVNAQQMTPEQMTTVQGSGHSGFALGALLLDVAPVVAGTSAWTGNGGLTPAKALGNAQVPGND